MKMLWFKDYSRVLSWCARERAAYFVHAESSIRGNGAAHYLYKSRARVIVYEKTLKMQPQLNPLSELVFYMAALHFLAR